MLKSYFKTAWRFLLKNRTFSFINIFGLTLGTICCLYILLYVSDQYSYDRHHRDAKDIYRVVCTYDIKAKGITEHVATTASLVSPMMKQDFGEVEQYTRVIPFAGIAQNLLKYKGKSVYEKDAVYVDSTFFDVFNYHFVRGNALDALREPHSVVLLSTVADKLFGREDPIGKTFAMENAYDNSMNFTVRGVVDGGLGKTHLHANMFFTMNSGGAGGFMNHTTQWTSNTYVSSYVKLRRDADPATLEKRLPVFLEHYAGEQLKKAGLSEKLSLQPVADIHTTPGLRGMQLDEAVSSSFLNVLLLIAVLIQLIACINFMNLSTARASKRAKEVGVRKVVGAGRGDLIKQFLGESFLITLISVVIALPLLAAAMPFFNTITQSNVTLSFLQNGRTVLLLFGLVFLTGLIAGSYPAFYLSAFRAIRVIKGNFTSHISASGIRRGLVVFQFVLSIVLISGIVIIYSQLNFIKNKDLGFEKDQKLIFSFYSQDALGRIRGFMNDLRNLPEVRTVSSASKYFGNEFYFSNSFFLRGQKEADQKGVDYIISDENFVKANGIKIVSGRDFWGMDSSKLLINESYAKVLGLDPRHAVGVTLYDNQNRSAEIVGIMKDFNYSTLHKNVEGFLLWKRGPHDDPWPNLTVNTNTANYASLLGKIETIWHKDMPGEPFSYSFLDEMVQRQYAAEISMSHIIDSFTIMAIIISSLGLFGLAAFSAEQRSKEIGIRKILGATVTGIARLLSKDFLGLVVLAFVIATPIAWWVMNKWLQGFAYKIVLSWWMFAVAGLLSLLIAMVTVSFQAIRAAMVNPIRSLRSE